MNTRYAINGNLELLAPLHLGAGTERRLATDEQPWVADVARAHDGKPYVPGSSLKGALRALAVRLGCDSTWVGSVFGAPDRRGCVQFRHAYVSLWQADSRWPGYDPALNTAPMPHVALDHVTRTAQERKLYVDLVVPPKTCFALRLVVQRLSEPDLLQLAWLLEQMERDPRFGLGSGHGAVRCPVRWRRGQQPDVQKFSSREAATWFDSLGGDRYALQHQEARVPVPGGTGLFYDVDTWQHHASTIELAPQLPAPVRPTAASKPPACIGLALNFHTPFLVAHRQPRGQKPDIVPRVDHAGRLLLPSSGFIGALSSQCARILRTMGLPAAPGHDRAPHQRNRALDDLTSVLFGTAGWAATVTASDLVGEPVTNTTPIQEFVAIDRVMGGGKDSAKFNVRRPDHANLTGELAIDCTRLEATGKLPQALGLLALALRDLEEGDIAFGYGRSKGFGQCTAAGLLAGLRQAAGPVTLESCIEALRRLAVPVAGATTELTPIDPGAHDLADVPVAVEGNLESHFHNPYVFIPFAPVQPDIWQPHASLRESRHSHATYAGFSGRLVLELETTTPIFIGSTRGTPPGANQPTPVNPFNLNGQRAIPATSLRGVVSSMFESVSGSNTRVLEDSVLTTRVPNRPGHWQTERKPLKLSTGAILGLRSPDLRPFGQTDRDRLSPVELLFGVVEDMGRKEDREGINGDAARGYAGKVRIGFGRPVGPVRCLPDVTLKELSSPKPPCPVFYFKRTDATVELTKADLVSSPTKFLSKGLKRHLHHPRDEQSKVTRDLDDYGRFATQGGRPPWKSKFDAQADPGNKRRVRVAPIDRKQKFYFEVDFDNLDQVELAQLCASLQPFAMYEHKIGMGKPIGLGSVHIEPVGLFVVDRHRRYCGDALDAARYAAHWVIASERAPAALPPHLSVELSWLRKPSTLRVSAGDLSRQGFLSVPGNDAVRRALQLTGVPGHVTVPVHYPQSTALELETEHYRWFVKNDTKVPAQQDRLADITANTPRPPRLKRN